MIKKLHVRRLFVLALMVCLTVGAMSINVQSSLASSPLASSTAAQLVGGTDWGCGLLVGAVGGTIALIAGGATFGFGAALAISVTIHVGAIACAA